MPHVTTSSFVCSVCVYTSLPVSVNNSLRKAAVGCQNVWSSCDLVSVSTSSTIWVFLATQTTIDSTVVLRMSFTYRDNRATNIIAQALFRRWPFCRYWWTVACTNGMQGCFAQQNWVQTVKHYRCLAFCRLFWLQFSGFGLIKSTCTLGLIQSCTIHILYNSHLVQYSLIQSWSNIGWMEKKN